VERLRLRPDLPDLADFRSGATPYRQSDSGAIYAAALGRLDDAGLVYACDCTRTTFAAHRARMGAPWAGPGCPGNCRGRVGAVRLPGATLRVVLGEGTESWTDLLAGPRSGDPVNGGDPAIRDRHGNWTYAFCVVVDDLRQDVTLVVRGHDLLEATPAQIRLARLLGREWAPVFLHHPLVRTPDGRKLSKADQSTSIRSMLDRGRTPAELFGLAAHLTGLHPDAGPVEPEELGALFA
jgi:glutamyl/glutaminyl-tRNA synthetase